MIDAFNKGGTAHLSYSRSGVLLCVYLVAFVIAMLVNFQRRYMVD